MDFMNEIDLDNIANLIVKIHRKFGDSAMYRDTKHSTSPYLKVKSIFDNWLNIT